MIIRNYFPLVSLCLVMTMGCAGSVSQAPVTSPAPSVEPSEVQSPSPSLPPEIIPDKIGELADARMTFQGISRLYTYYVPSTYKVGDRLPLMISLHGQGLNAAQQLKDSQFDVLAERENFILIVPNCVTIDSSGNLASEGYTYRDLPDVGAENRRWNVKNEAHDLKGVDDVAYISALIDSFSKWFNVDTDRVYISGMSNGALMSIRLAVELTDKVAGIGAVGGTVPYYYMTKDISGPLKVVFINGDSDPIVPIGGYPGYSPSIWEGADWFNKQFGVTRDAAVTELPQTVEGDETKVVKYEWPEKNSSQVVVYVVEGGGHTWPGGTQYLPEASIGKLSKHYSASELIWNELKGFHK